MLTTQAIHFCCHIQSVVPFVYSRKQLSSIRTKTELSFFIQKWYPKYLQSTVVRLRGSKLIAYFFSKRFFLKVKLPIKIGSLADHCLAKFFKSSVPQEVVFSFSSTQNTCPWNFSQPFLQAHSCGMFSDCLPKLTTCNLGQMVTKYFFQNHATITRSEWEL